MRELAFGLAYEEGFDPQMDVFGATPSLRARVPLCVWSDGAYWHVDVVEGPAEALVALDDAVGAAERCPDCLDRRSSVRNRRTETLSAAPNRRVYYSYWEADGDCPTVAELAMRHLGRGTLVRATRRERECWWTVVVPSDENEGAFYDALVSALPPAVDYVMGHLRDVSEWDADPAAATLPTKQRDVVEVAVELGYYDTPRRATQSTVADALGVPRSTVSYRLRRAEASMAHAFLRRRDDVDAEANRGDGR